MTRDLLDAIAAWEATAREAAESVPQIRSEGEVLGVWIGREWHESRPFVAHVLANDPAHVLRLSAALRKVVELHQPIECSNARCSGGGLHCATCEEGLAAGESGTVHFPCPTLRALASVWDEPGDNT